MSGIVCCKKVKIKPENEVTAEGVVTDCRYAGSSSFGIGPFSKTTHIYKVFVKVADVEKPLVMKIKEPDGWNADIVGDIRAFDRMVGNVPTPVKAGDKLTVAYDRRKPKKCNVVD